VSATHGKEREITRRERDKMRQLTHIEKNREEHLAEKWRDGEMLTEEERVELEMLLAIEQGRKQ